MGKIARYIYEDEMIWNENRKGKKKRENIRRKELEVLVKYDKYERPLIKAETRENI